MKILYLYSELVGYQIPVFKVYVTSYSAEVHVISWDKNKLKPFVPINTRGVHYYKRSEYSTSGLIELSKKIAPEIIYISGWMDHGYLKVARYFKKRNIKVITGLDDKWRGSFRQRLGSLAFPLIFRKYFSHAWVAGPYQFEFAKRIGFKNEEIIFDLLTANTNIFCKEESQEPLPEAMPKTFLYVGNFRMVKGFDILIEAFRIYQEKFKGDWSLICVGNGAMEHYMNGNAHVKHLPYSTEEELVEISKQASVFVLPSRNDQWGVVVHEFAALGMPLLLSENVGAKATFFIEGFNGLLFRNNSAEQLAEKMAEFSKMSRDHLIEMGQNSIILSKRIDIKTAAANFMSLLNR